MQIFLLDVNMFSVFMTVRVKHVKVQPKLKSHLLFTHTDVFL